MSKKKQYVRNRRTRLACARRGNDYFRNWTSSKTLSQVLIDGFSKVNAMLSKVAKSLEKLNGTIGSDQYFDLRRIAQISEHLSTKAKQS